MRALVLGGGVAGLAAAIALSRSGYQVQLLEARDRDQPSPRHVHVHRLVPEAIADLEHLTSGPTSGLTSGLPSALAEAGGQSGRWGQARQGQLTWHGNTWIADLSMIERALAAVAEAQGVRLGFGDAVETLAPGPVGWQATTPSGSPMTADLLVDATGGGRISLGLLEPHLPDLTLDDLGSAQVYVSWQGSGEPGPAWMVGWAAASDGAGGTALTGLMQTTADGRVRLTCRHATDAGPGQAPPLEAIRQAGGPELAQRLDRVSLQDRPVRYLTPGARRVDLDAVDLSGLPPLILVGDALLQSPPRFGEGMRHALDHARQIEAALSRNTHPHQIARDLSLSARRVWLGVGMVPEA